MRGSGNCKARSDLRLYKSAWRIILWLVLGLIWIVPGMILMSTLASTLAATGPTQAMFVSLAAMVVVVGPVMTWLMLRFSAILPAAALGKPLRAIALGPCAA